MIGTNFFYQRTTLGFFFFFFIVVYKKIPKENHIFIEINNKRLYRWTH